MRDAYSRPGRGERRGLCLVATARLTQIGEESLERRREGNREFKSRVGDRVSEAEGPGVKGQSAKISNKVAKLRDLDGPSGPTASIGLITDYRDAQVGQMDPDLVGPSSLEASFEVGEAFERLQHGKVGDRRLPLPGGADGHAEAVSRVTSDRGFDHPLSVRESAMNQGVIASLDAPHLKLG